MSEVELEKQGDACYRVGGVLSFGTVPRLLDQTARLFQGDSAQVEIDLAGVTHSDSAGVALLVEWMREARRRDADIRYVNVPAQMRSIARVSSLDNILPFAKA